MGGGLMQLVAYGAQDIYLTGNPQITFFKVVYRRHTNFSMESIQQTWQGNTGGNSGRVVATISRNGDLVHKMYIELSRQTGLTGHANTNNPSANYITNVEVEIGGQMIDRQSGAWMETWAELTEPNPTGVVTGTAAANSGTLFQIMSGMGGVSVARVTGGIVYVPLMFWFCRNPGLALPLIALQYHEVKIILDYDVANSWTEAPENKLWVDYIYLDTDERRRFAQVSHEYLIEQIQSQNITKDQSDLNFNHPVKELVWTGPWKQSDGSKTNGTNGSQTIGTVILKLNGHDRFAARDIKYFTRTQVHQYHSGPGGLSGTGNTIGTSDSSEIGTTTTQLSGRFNDSIGVYSFSLKPEEHQPSGTCNFSRIDNAQLVSPNMGSLGLTVYAVNYNVLRIMSGMGGLAYSN